MSEKSISTAEPVDEAPNRSQEPRDAAESRNASAQVVELEGRLLRALADLDNLRKRYERELRRERSNERRRVAAEWLPIIDNLELALRHAGPDGGGLIEGIAAVHDQAVAVLDRIGFRRFEDIGRRFDPARHDAVSTVPADAAPDTVVATLRPGYESDEEILRPAKVVVARSSPPEGA
jgi:molecular chaperone GrpE